MLTQTNTLKARSRDHLFVASSRHLDKRNGHLTQISKLQQKSTSMMGSQKQIAISTLNPTYRVTSVSMSLQNNDGFNSDKNWINQSQQGLKNLFRNIMQPDPINTESVYQAFQQDQNWKQSIKNAGSSVNQPFQMKGDESLQAYGQQFSGVSRPPQTPINRQLVPPPMPPGMSLKSTSGAPPYYHPQNKDYLDQLKNQVEQLQSRIEQIRGAIPGTKDTATAKDTTNKTNEQNGQNVIPENQNVADQPQQFTIKNLKDEEPSNEVPNQKQTQRQFKVKHNEPQRDFARIMLIDYIEQNFNNQDLKDAIQILGEKQRNEILETKQFLEEKTLQNQLEKYLEKIDIEKEAASNMQQMVSDKDSIESQLNAEQVEEIKALIHNLKNDQKIQKDTVILNEKMLIYIKDDNELKPNDTDQKEIANQDYESQFKNEFEQQVQKAMDQMESVDKPKQELPKTKAKENSEKIQEKEKESTQAETISADQAMINLAQDSELVKQPQIKRTGKFLDLNQIQKHDITEPKQQVSQQEEIDKQHIVEGVTKRDYWESIAQADDQGNYLDIGNTVQIQAKTIDMRDHQIQRIQYFLSLKINKESKERILKLQLYQQELENLKGMEDLEKIKFIAKKGDKMEQWQAYLQDIDDIKHGKKGLSSSLKKSPEFMNKIQQAANNGVQIDEDFKDFAGGGKAMENVEVKGWGGMAKISIDNETGKVKEVERKPTESDVEMAKYYTNYLRKQFEQMDQIEEFEKLSFSNTDGDKDVKSYKKNGQPPNWDPADGEHPNMYD